MHHPAIHAGDGDPAALLQLNPVFELPATGIDNVTVALLRDYSACRARFRAHEDHRSEDDLIGGSHWLRRIRGYILPSWRQETIQWVNFDVRRQRHKERHIRIYADKLLASPQAQAIYKSIFGISNVTRRSMHLIVNAIRPDATDTALDALAQEEPDTASIRKRLSESLSSRLIIGGQKYCSFANHAVMKHPCSSYEFFRTRRPLG
mmetsp:Transcript_91066/g.161311  ORF Transcript_91066/g.161311 Transcript_91066/m.161311 type:complete len:206 (-) Transcript_91066:165-782(-)